jgi:hypothetical protein
MEDGFVQVVGSSVNASIRVMPDLCLIRAVFMTPGTGWFRAWDHESVEGS